MNEIFYLTEEAPEGGHTARALGFLIFAEADTMDELKIHVREAARYHFDDEDLSKIVQLHFVKDEARLKYGH